MHVTHIQGSLGSQDSLGIKGRAPCFRQHGESTDILLKCTAPCQGESEFKSLFPLLKGPDSGPFFVAGGASARGMHRDPRK